MLYALANLHDTSHEGGYVVRHHRPVSDFGRPLPGVEVHQPRRNPLMAAYPLLWPYGRGGIEEGRQESLSFNEHVKWALQYYDRRFRTHHSFPFVAFGIEQKRQALMSARVQMRRRDFEQDSLALATLTIADLKKAEIEESQHVPITNKRARRLHKHVYATSGRIMGSDQSRAAYRGQIWGTTLYLNPPSIWMTINPTDLHDPVAQVFAGEEIDMDRFVATVGPSADRRARNIARDPFAAAKFFFYIIDTMLRTLFGVRVIKDHVRSDFGILGLVSGYFGVVEAQGRGTLHLHMMVWLIGAPNAEEMKKLLTSQEF